MSKNKKPEKDEDTKSGDKLDKQNQNTDSDESQDPKESHPSHSTRYIKDKKTGKWKIINPAGSKAYNYLYRGDFPDD